MYVCTLEQQLLTAYSLTRSTVRGASPTVAELRELYRRGKHPALAQTWPVITELPLASRTDLESVNLRAAMLALLSGEEHMLPEEWLTSTALHMIGDPQRRAVLFILAMHSRCNLEVHVDPLGTAVMYHAQDGMKMVLVWPPTEANLEKLGQSLLTGAGHRPLDATRPFEKGVKHILHPGERLTIAPLAIHVVVNLSPAISVGVNFNCQSSVALLKHLNGTAKSHSAIRSAGWYCRLLSAMICSGLELKTPAHLGTKLKAF